MKKKNNKKKLNEKDTTVRGMVVVGEPGCSVFRFWRSGRENRIKGSKSDVSDML